MEIGDWHASRDLNDLYRELRSMDLEPRVAELEAFGFTVLPEVLPPQLVDRLRAAILADTEDRTGVAPDVDTGATHPGINLAPYLLGTDPVFEEALLWPETLALVTYLLGQSCLLSSITSHLKGPGGELPLHADVSGNGVPPPYPHLAMVANCNFALTDYTREGGAFAVVPGSHRWCRPPSGREVSLGEGANPDAVPVEVPAGSAIVFHGNTWHGSFPRSIPGFRINLALYFCRRFVEPQSRYRDAVPPEVLERNGERFARLVGMDTHHGWQRDDFAEKYANARAGFRASRSWHG